MILTIAERFALNSILPEKGDITILKDLRLLKEELAISQEDRNKVQFFNEYECLECKAKGVFPAPVKCGKCDKWMYPNGQIGCSDWELEKEISIPDYLLGIITSTLKQANESKTLEERHISIYEKFVKEE